MPCRSCFKKTIRHAEQLRYCSPMKRAPWCERPILMMQRRAQTGTSFADYRHEQCSLWTRGQPSVCHQRPYRMNISCRRDRNRGRRRSRSYFRAFRTQFHSRTSPFRARSFVDDQSWLFPTDRSLIRPCTPLITMADIAEAAALRAPLELCDSGGYSDFEGLPQTDLWTISPSADLLSSTSTGDLGTTHSLVSPPTLSSIRER